MCGVWFHLGVNALVGARDQAVALLDINVGR
jgi:hypothetical protein